MGERCSALLDLTFKKTLPDPFVRTFRFLDKNRDLYCNMATRPDNSKELARLTEYGLTPHIVRIITCLMINMRCHPTTAPLWNIFEFSETKERYYLKTRAANKCVQDHFADLFTTLKDHITHKSQALLIDSRLDILTAYTFPPAGPFVDTDMMPEDLYGFPKRSYPFDGGDVTIEAAEQFLVDFQQSFCYEESMVKKMVDASISMHLKKYPEDNWS